MINYFLLSIFLAAGAMAIFGIVAIIYHRRGWENTACLFFIAADVAALAIIAIPVMWLYS